MMAGAFYTRMISESFGCRKIDFTVLTSTKMFVDTAQGYILKQANDLIRADIERFMAVLKQKARISNTVMIGRTRTVCVLNATFGLKLAT